MAQIGICGIGDMGSGLATNLIKAGFTVRGFDPKPERMAAFEAMGGIPATHEGDAGKGSDAVFIMVMNGREVENVIFGHGGKTGIFDTLAKGAAIILTATIKPSEARAIAARLEGSGLHFIDTPVSGGRPGAQGGTLTLMAAGSDAALESVKAPLEAISGTLHRVGTQIGEGQTMKACLQSLIGSIFAGAFEACGLAAQAGVDAQALEQVFTTSAAGCGITQAAVSHTIAGTFEKTGSHINTMHKDLTISLDMAEELGVPLFTASTAMQMFTAARAKFPDGDNQVVAKVTETFIGKGLRS